MQSTYPQRPAARAEQEEQKASPRAAHLRPTLTGQTLGRYELEDELGQGGMSVVYRARDGQLQREVAIKVLHSFLAEQPEAKERFHREAVAVARLRHPHIIEIHDYSGTDAPLSYIVTELVQGEPLSKWLARHPLKTPEAALILARPIVAALEHAHEHGIIHRDLKPENILLGRGGALKLTDFGIARMLDNQTLTMTGTLLGSPAYMAPEYIEGNLTDARGDIFSFGAMLYQLTVGKLPFEANSPHGLLKKIASCEYVPPQQANPHIPTPLARLIERCLTRLPDDRYASATALLADIDELLATLSMDWQQERRHLLEEPGDYCTALAERLLPTYIHLGKTALHDGRTGTALAYFDRALGLDPGNQVVLALIAAQKRRRWVLRAARTAGMGVLGALLVTAVTVVWQSRRESAVDPKLQAAAATVLESRQPEEPAVPAAQQRSVTFIVRGSGDLYLDDVLLQRNLQNNISHLVPAGTHVVRFQNNDQRLERTINIPMEGPVDGVELELGPTEPASPSQAPPTSVHTAREPSDAQDAETPAPMKDVTFMIVGWANVELDGRTVAEGHTGKLTLPLSHGTHALQFTNPAFEPLDMSLRVSDTEPPERVKVRLEPLPASLRVKGAPNGAVVEVAGNTRIINSETRDLPISINMDGKVLQELDVVVRKAGSADFRQRMRFRPGQEQTLEVLLKPL